MAYETKVILALLAKTVSSLDTVEKAYNAIVEAASVEGLTLPSYAEALEKLNK